MKILSFSAIEILPALLDGSKKQTIRSAWKPHSNNLKPARFAIGEKVKLMWKSRGTPSDASFCGLCGNVVQNIHRFTVCKTDGEIPYIITFKKCFGVETISEVFQIEMWTGNDAPLITGYSRKDTLSLALKDGFSKSVDFYNYFSKYDLSTPKKFWVYRW